MLRKRFSCKVKVEKLKVKKVNQENLEKIAKAIHNCLKTTSLNKVSFKMEQVEVNEENVEEFLSQYEKTYFKQLRCLQSLIMRQYFLD